MIIVEFPEADVYDIEVLVAEEVRITVDVRLSLDIEETLENQWFFEFSKGHFIVVFAIGHVEHSMDDAKGVPLLELRGLLEKVKARVNF